MLTGLVEILKSYNFLTFFYDIYCNHAHLQERLSFA